MRIVCLAENTACDERLGAEHGLSLYIEYGSRKILFDMGQSDLFLKNAGTLGIDLAEVDIAVVSHGHYDHGGGLAAFLAVNDSAPIYVSRSAFMPHWHGSEKYIGLDPALADHPRLKMIDGETVLGAGITLCRCEDDSLLYPIDAAGLCVGRDGVLVPEDFCHEQYLLLEENGKRILISGCSHRGILNIMHRFHPDVLIGGFHYSKIALGDALAAYADVLARYDTDYYTCHCTGNAQFAFMKNRLGRLAYLAGGAVLDL